MTRSAARRRSVLAEAGFVVVPVVGCFLLLTALDIWTVYLGQRGLVENGERVPFDWGGTVSESIALIPAQLAIPVLWLGVTTVVLVLVSWRFAPSAGRRSAVAGAVALALCLPTILPFVPYLVPWGPGESAPGEPGPISPGLLLLLVTPVVAMAVWACGAGLHRWAVSRLRPRAGSR